MSLRNLQLQKQLLQQQVKEYQELSKRELERLRQQKLEIESVISATRSNIEELSEHKRPQSAVSQSNNDHNRTLTSNFTMETVDIEELRQQIAATSFELADQKNQFKK